MAERTVALWPFMLPSLTLLSACAGVVINGVEMTPLGIARAAAQGIARHIVTEVGTGESMKSGRVLEPVLEDYLGGRPLSNATLSSIQQDCQEQVDKIIERIENIRSANPTAPEINRKGPIGRVTVKVIDSAEINAWTKEGAQKEIFVPSGLLLESLKRLIQAQQKEEQEARGIEKLFTGFTSDVPYIEYGELLRFVLAHEATHLWLHDPSDRVLDRELEADSWGTLLSASLSQPQKLRANATKDVLSGGFRGGNSRELSMLSAKSGGEVVVYLYGDAGVYPPGVDGRPTFAQREAEIKKRDGEALEKYLSSMSRSDRNLYRIWHAIVN